MIQRHSPSITIWCDDVGCYEQAVYRGSTHQACEDMAEQDGWWLGNGNGEVLCVDCRFKVKTSET